MEVVWEKGPGSVSNLGAFFDSEILELSLAFAFKASCITLGSSGSSFSVEKLPPSPCLRVYVWLGVFVSVFVCVFLCVPVILCGTLCVFLSHICGRRRSSHLSLLFPGFVCARLYLSSPFPSLCLFSMDIFVFLTHP